MLIRQVWHFEPATQSKRQGFWLLAISFHISNFNLSKHTSALMCLVTGSLSNQPAVLARIPRNEVERTTNHSSANAFRTLKVPQVCKCVQSWRMPHLNVQRRAGRGVVACLWNQLVVISRDRQKTDRRNRMKCIQQPLLLCANPEQGECHQQRITSVSQKLRDTLESCVQPKPACIFEI